MESYTTISVKPRIKAKTKLLKGNDTYTEYLEGKVEEDWEESEFTEEDLEETEVE